ncbi:LysR family transcriptional regulator [Nesterenkonia haasae]|uniref:LysR family transcriptional regulator n=1 Tax=Nesterenkonia haasae TaxID=2587813 RepID=UPI0013909A2F|nr:LysR family transcriptional regulator [Nesterenkonia haasae]NDK33109.1 LysR family transcriptional regulator [Nesterenkonia haasae]
MDTALLETFLAVARWRTFTAAAEELHVAQSTVTARVQLLERELGVQLFERTPTGTHLTEASARIRDQAQHILDLQQAMVRSSRGRGTEAQGGVVVGAPESICAYRLPAVVAAVRRSYPLIDIHLVPSGTSSAARGVSDRRLDIGLVLDAASEESRLESVEIGQERVAVFAPFGHPLTGADGLEWAALRKETFYLLEEGCSYSDRLLKELSEALPAAPRVTRFGSIEAARACVEAGLGLTVLPTVACTASEREHRVARVSGLPRPEEPLRMITDPRRAMPLAVQRVMETITAVASSTQAPTEDLVPAHDCGTPEPEPPAQRQAPGGRRGRR